MHLSHQGEVRLSKIQDAIWTGGLTATRCDVVNP